MNEKLKKAYERVGLSENVSREEINKRFDLLLKRRRSKASDDERSAPEEDFQAFKFILDSLDEQEIQEAEQQRLAKYGKLSGFASKWERFMRLYKTHVIVSIIIVIVLAVGGNALYNNWQHKKYLASLPPVDAEIMLWAISGFRTRMARRMIWKRQLSPNTLIGSGWRPVSFISRKQDPVRIRLI